MTETEVAVIINELKHIKADTEEIKDHVQKTNGRVTNLEKFRHTLTGMWLATVIIISIFWAIFKAFA